MNSELVEIKRRLADRLEGGMLPYGMYDQELEGARALERWMNDNSLVQAWTHKTPDTEYFLRGTGTGWKFANDVWQSLALCEMDHKTVWRRNGKPAVLVGIPSSSFNREKEGVRMLRSLPDVCISISENERDYGWSRGRVAFIEYRRITNFGHGPFCDCDDEKEISK